MSSGPESAAAEPVPPLRCATEMEDVEQALAAHAATGATVETKVEALAICIESLDGSDKLSIDSNRRAIGYAFSVMNSQMKVIQYNLRLMKKQ